MEPTYRPHKVKRIRKCGYRSRRKTVGGRKILAARRRKGRRRLTQI